MKTIIINSQKGGSGKTALTAHLAVEAERAGDGPVYVIDTDPQGTLSTWHEHRVAAVPQRVDLPLDRLADGLAELERRGAGVVLIDTAPTRAEANVDLFKQADLVVVPVKPSPSDLWSVAVTVSLLKGVGVPFLFVLTQVKGNAGITAQAAAALSHHGKVAQVFVGDRTLYASAMTDGRTAPELAPRGPAAAETAALWANIKTCLHASMQKNER